jgi:hypothetical protein
MKLTYTFTFTFLVPSLCGLSMFKTLNSVFNTCHFIKIFKTLNGSTSIGYPQVLKNCLSRKQTVKSTQENNKEEGTRKTEGRRDMNT